MLACLLACCLCERTALPTCVRACNTQTTTWSVRARMHACMHTMLVLAMSSTRVPCVRTQKNCRRPSTSTSSCVYVVRVGACLASVVTRACACCVRSCGRFAISFVRFVQPTNRYFHSNRLCYRLSPRITWTVRMLVRLLTTVGLVVVLSTKLHYTLDVAIAIYLNLRIWDAYHTYVTFVWAYYYMHTCIRACA